jgi:hypothetical protein
MACNGSVKRLSVRGSWKRRCRLGERSWSVVAYSFFASSLFVQFFLELWTEIDRRASLREKAQTHVSLPVPKGTPEDLPEGTIFEELVIQYRKLVKRAEDMIIQQVSSEIESGLRAHFASLLSYVCPLHDAKLTLIACQTRLGLASARRDRDTPDIARSDISPLGRPDTASVHTSAHGIRGALQTHRIPPLGTHISA